MELAKLRAMVESGMKGGGRFSFAPPANDPQWKAIDSLAANHLSGGEVSLSGVSAIDASVWLSRRSPRSISCKLLSADLQPSLRFVGRCAIRL